MKCTKSHLLQENEYTANISQISHIRGVTNPKMNINEYDIIFGYNLCQAYDTYL